jgi:hypothetical protein
MPSLSFQVTLSLKNFIHDDFDMLDESLEDFISQGSSAKACSNKPKQREVNLIQPQLILYPPLNKKQPINKPILIPEPPKNIFL